MTFQEALDTIRKWQRHRLLREFDEGGQVLPENLNLSKALDLLIDEALPTPGDQRSMTVTAKFVVNQILDMGSSRTIEMTPVYSSDKSSPNYSWSQATPNGKLSMTITNPNAYGQFAVGKKFMLTFTAEEN